MSWNECPDENEGKRDRSPVNDGVPNEGKTKQGKGARIKRAR